MKKPRTSIAGRRRCGAGRVANGSASAGNYAGFRAEICAAPIAAMKWLTEPSPTGLRVTLGQIVGSGCQELIGRPTTARDRSSTERMFGKQPPAQRCEGEHDGD